MSAAAPKRVLVLGATSAIAQETSREFAAAKARLFLVARDVEKLRAVTEDLLVRGAGAVETCACDLTDTAAHPAILSEAAAVWEGLDVALIAYGTLPDQKVCEEDPAALRLAMETNCMSVVSLLAQLANILEKQRGSVLAVIGSVAGDRGRRSNYAYGAAKAAIETFSAGLRLRLAAVRVRVVVVKPGWVDTPMTAHLPKNALYASARSVGHGIYKAILSPHAVVYLPWFWRWIMLIVRMIPEPIFAKLNL